MVEQHIRKKTSSTRGQSRYRIAGFIDYQGIVPDITNVSASGDYVLATVLADLDKPPKRPDLSIMPHIYLANLPSYDAEGNMNLSPGRDLRLDAKDVAMFVRKYGVLRGHASPSDMRIAIEGRYGSIPDPLPLDDAFPLISREGVAEFAAAQNALRQAWAGDHTSIWGDMAGEVGTDALGIDALPSHKGLVLVAKDLWKFICILFLHDYSAGKIGVCENPDCPAPYFLKKRRTQKICEAGSCTVWAQRRYALRWWHKNQGSEQEKSQNKKGKRK